MEIIEDERLWGGFALDQGTAKALSARLEILRPGRIVECGSGSSTLIMADYAARHGAKVLSLEHDTEYGQRTLNLLDKYGLGKRVTLKLVGLDPTSWYGWYPPTNDKIDFMLVDGPPGVTGGRGQALPALWTWLADEFEVWLDDAGRPGEKQIINRWQDKFPISVQRLGRVARVTRMKR